MATTNDDRFIYLCDDAPLPDVKAERVASGGAGRKRDAYARRERRRIARKRASDLKRLGIGAGAVRSRVRLTPAQVARIAMRRTQRRTAQAVAEGFLLTCRDMGKKGQRQVAFCEDMARGGGGAVPRPRRVKTRRACVKNIDHLFRGDWRAPSVDFRLHGVYCDGQRKRFVSVYGDLITTRLTVRQTREVIRLALLRGGIEPNPGPRDRPKHNKPGMHQGRVKRDRAAPARPAAIRPPPPPGCYAPAVPQVARFDDVEAMGLGDDQTAVAEHAAAAFAGDGVPAVVAGALARALARPASAPGGAQRRLGVLVHSPEAPPPPPPCPPPPDRDWRPRLAVDPALKEKERADESERDVTPPPDEDSGDDGEPRATSTSSVVIEDAPIVDGPGPNVLQQEFLTACQGGDVLAAARRMSHLQAVRLLREGGKARTFPDCQNFPDPPPPPPVPGVPRPPPAPPLGRVVATLVGNRVVGAHHAPRPVGHGLVRRYGVRGERLDGGLGDPPATLSDFPDPFDPDPPPGHDPNHLWAPPDLPPPRVMHRGRVAPLADTAEGRIARQRATFEGLEDYSREFSEAVVKRATRSTVVGDVSVRRDVRVAASDSRLIGDLETKYREGTFSVIVITALVNVPPREHFFLFLPLLWLFFTVAQFLVRVENVLPFLRALFRCFPFYWFTIYGPLFRRVRVEYVPHLLSACLSETDESTDADVAAANSRHKINRFTSFPIPSIDRVHLVEGTIAAVHAVQSGFHHVRGSRCATEPAVFNRAGITGVCLARILNTLKVFHGRRGPSYVQYVRMRRAWYEAREEIYRGILP